MAHYDWDINNVKQMTEAKQERAFKRVGSFIRSDARHSIRVSIRNSKPGEPPKAKRRTFKNTILFAADKNGVVVGPIYAFPANNTPHVLEAGGWRSDTIAKIRARWERANPEKARQQRKQWKAQQKASQNNGKPKRQRSQAELDHIREYYQKKGVPTAPTSQQLNKVVRFHIARRPYIEPAFNKNKQKTMALLN